MLVAAVDVVPARALLKPARGSQGPDRGTAGACPDRRTRIGSIGRGTLSKPGLVDTGEATSRQ